MFYCSICILVVAATKVEAQRSIVATNDSSYLWVMVASASRCFHGGPDRIKIDMVSGGLGCGKGGWGVGSWGRLVDHLTYPVKFVGQTDTGLSVANVASSGTGVDATAVPENHSKTSVLISLGLVYSSSRDSINSDNK